MARSSAENAPASEDRGEPRPRDPREDEAPPTDPTDERLAKAAKAGDREAFSELYERHARAVHGVLLALVRPQEVPDLLQEVFLLALRSIGRLERPERVAGWLCTIARNRARDVHKMKTPTRSMEELNSEPPSTEDSAADDEAEAAEVLELVRELPASYRETLVLRLVEGLTGPEIALHTGLTHGSVRVNLHRGMKLLRERLAQRGWEVQP